MKVKELIAVLETREPDREIVIFCSDESEKEYIKILGWSTATLDKSLKYNLFAECHVVLIPEKALRLSGE